MGCFRFGRFLWGNQALSSGPVTVSVNLNLNGGSLANDVTYSDWSASKTTTTKPTASDTLRITVTNTSYKYFHYHNTYDGSSANLDSIAKSSATQFTRTQGQALGTLPTPTRSGHTFNEWYSAASGGNKITSAAKVGITSNRTFHAHWTAA